MTNVTLDDERHFRDSFVILSKAKNLKPPRISISEVFMKTLLPFFFLSSLAFAQHNTAPNVSNRSDLVTFMTKLVCDDQETLDTRKAWEAGIYDAQVAVQSLRPKAGQSIKQDDIKKAVDVLASRNNHYGLSQGQCPNQSYWVITSPAPKPLAAPKDETITIAAEDYRNYCDNIRVDFAAAEKGQPRTILTQKSVSSTIEDLQVNTKLLPSGVISITCQPRFPAWQGPVLWYLVPVKEGAVAEIPESEALEHESSIIALQQWVNAVRKKEGLPPLADNHPRMQWLSEQLLKNSTIRHNRKLLEQAKQALKKNNARLVGENRVKAQTIQQMVWLLWHSPRHRSLILSREATHFSVASQRVKQEQLAVLVFGKF